MARETSRRAPRESGIRRRTHVVVPLIIIDVTVPGTVQATIGAEDIARSRLATTMGLPAETLVPVQTLSEITVPTATSDSLKDVVERALQQRPDLLAKIGNIRVSGKRAKLRQDQLAECFARRRS